MTTEAALAELRLNSGTQFDPAVVEVFVAGMLEPREALVSTATAYGA